MSCKTCSVNHDSAVPKGCKSKGSCMNGGCNKLNTYDWLTARGVEDVEDLNIIEVSFKNGAEKNFFRLPPYLNVEKRDIVVVDTGSGYDVGTVSLKGELVRLQLKKKSINRQNVNRNIIRIANTADLDRLKEARGIEMRVMRRARSIARTMGLEMKIGDVQYQGDLRKATFYYTANGRVDFRKLVRKFAKEFRVKIEMRQIGARQESSRIGGLGSCGRELCCSTWLTSFKTVNTKAARYQNIALNQAKLSGQCGRLKCCLNYELDTYIEALKEFPKNADVLKLKHGTARHVKTNFFKKKMFYSIDDGKGRHPMVAVDVERVREVLKMNKNGKKPLELVLQSSDERSSGFSVDLTGVIEFDEEKPSKNRSKRSTQSKSKKKPRRRNKRKSIKKPGSIRKNKPGSKRNN